MKIALIEIYPSKKANTRKMIDAHLRNSITLSEYLKCDLLLIENDFISALNKSYDILILSYGSRYAPFNLINELFKRNKNAKKFWLTNEYNLTPITSIVKYKHSIIGNFEKQPYTRNVINFHTLNLNLLLSKYPNELKNKKYDCIYYGTYRINRTKYYTKYLQKEIYLSTSSKNFKKFKHIGCNPKYISKLNWVEGKETLNLFKYQLYIEDEKTHDNYNNLANRYYEAGFCNNVVFFDENCRNTIKKSELNYYKEEVESYVVKDYKDLQNKIKECNKNFEKHLAIQKSWRMNEQLLKTQMLKDLKNIIYNGRK